MMSADVGTDAYARCFVVDQQPRDCHTKDTPDCIADPDRLRDDALHYLSTFDPEQWFVDPIVTLLCGEALMNNVVSDDEEKQMVDTKDAFGRVNGRQILAARHTLDRFKSHLQSYQSPTTDLRIPVREIEHLLLTEYAGKLIGDQCLDFGKQDGVTEMVEATEANGIERRLNDLLLRDEALGRITISRKPIFVSCVSNFTLFLDLFRKTLRSLELGIPVVVLSRSHSNTSQHSFRWTQLLMQLLLRETTNKVDPGMLSFCSASVPDMQTLIQDCSAYTGNLYATCSRTLALHLTRLYPGQVVASTGGPNTMVICDHATLEHAAVQKAIQTSASIESAGQCTALRHVVIPKQLSASSSSSSSSSLASLSPPPSKADSDPTTALSVSAIWKSVPTLNRDDPMSTALERRIFDGVYTSRRNDLRFSSDSSHHGGSVDKDDMNDDDNASYYHVPSANVWYKIRDTLPTASSSSLPEYWRQVVVDFTALDGMVQQQEPPQTANATQQQSSNTNNHHKHHHHDHWTWLLAHWLNVHQPISLAINGPRHRALDVGFTLFATTALVVYTVGSIDDPTMLPAMTCQARPQDGELFGEFPPRSSDGSTTCSSMTDYTRFPVLIPSSNPSYDAVYNVEYLQQQLDLKNHNHCTESEWNASTITLMNQVTDTHVRGYCRLLIQYLQDACRINPKVGFGKKPHSSRTCAWGLQRPPLGSASVLRCDATTTWDDVAPVFLLFHVTNAHAQVQIRIASSNKRLISFAIAHQLPFVVDEEVGDTQRQRKYPASSSSSSPSPSSSYIFHTSRIASLNGRFPLVGQFVSLYFPIGHIKSTKANDEEFLRRARSCDKWLHICDEP